LLEETSAIVEKESAPLGSLPIGARLVLRCRKDWREAVVSQFYADKVVLIVNSITGKTYRVRRPIDAEIFFDGKIAVLPVTCDEIEWRESLIKFDTRW